MMCLHARHGRERRRLSWIKGFSCVRIRWSPTRSAVRSAMERGTTANGRIVARLADFGAAARWSMRSLPKRSRGPRSASAIAPNARPEASSRRTTSTRSACTLCWDAVFSRTKRPAATRTLSR
jgi:hypothetical protein